MPRGDTRYGPSHAARAHTGAHARRSEGPDALDTVGGPRRYTGGRYPGARSASGRHASFSQRGAARVSTVALFDFLLPAIPGRTRFRRGFAVRAFRCLAMRARGLVDRATTEFMRVSGDDHAICMGDGVDAAGPRSASQAASVLAMTASLGRWRSSVCTCAPGWPATSRWLIPGEALLQVRGLCGRVAANTGFHAALTSKFEAGVEGGLIYFAVDPRRGEYHHMDCPASSWPSVYLRGDGYPHSHSGRRPPSSRCRWTFSRTSIFRS